MYGQHPLLRPGGGGGSGRGRGVAPPTQQGQHLNPNIFSNPNLFHLQQNPNLLPHLNPFLQNPSNFPPIQQIPSNIFPILQIPNTYCSTVGPHNNNSRSKNYNKFPQQQHPQDKLQNEAIERVDRAVVKACGDLLASKENVSAWKVSQGALLTVKADSWESLGFQMQQVPSLNRLLVTEGKISAFIHCFVAVRRITSLYDLDVAICKNEGIERFEELELGPLVRHPLVMHYFSVSSDVAEVHRITSEEIISYLFEFMDTQKGKLKVDVFLDFIAKKQSVSNREKLCVRIQNLGTYATYIRQSRQSEDRALEKCLKKLKKESAKRGRKRPLFSSQKKQLDDHFGSISQSIKLFSSENKFCGKHIRFVSSSSEDDVSVDSECEDNQNENNSPSNCSTLLSNLRADRVSSCPYPSAAEEITRLGLKSGVDGSSCALGDSVRGSADIESSRRKRKSENISFKASSPEKLLKREKFDTNIKRKSFSNQGTNDYLLANDSLRMFITTWKEACRGNSVDEVLERMLLIYNTRKKKKVKALFTSYPCVGLLNVAVTSMKFGMWDSMYDTFQAFSQQDLAGSISKNSADCISIDIEQAEKDVSITGQKTLTHEHVTVEDIVKKLSGYFDDDITRNENPSREKKFLFLRKLSQCESWLMKQYSVKKFDFLGYGEYYMFLEKHMHLLPRTLQKCLIGDTNENNFLEARLQALQLDVLLSQASNSLWENETVSLQNVSELLTRQFPLVSLKLVKSDLTVNIGHGARENKGNLTSKCLLFSAPLLKPCSVRDPLSQNEKKLPETFGSEIYVPKEGIFGTVRTKDAIEVLLRAPMLADLHLWSHWDLVFAPSLGPIVEWLLNEVNNKELLFLATKDGKIIRVDHSATVDSFLKVFIGGSSFETAVQLLSLYVLYGGEQHVPLSLLKCHARQAFEVIINNLKEMELQEDKNPFFHEKPFRNQHIVDKSSSSNLTINLQKNKNAMNKVVPVASTFILDCLSYFPLEFCSSAADILLSGLQYFVKDASSAILTACKQIEKRLMLHEVGISLGIVEWVNDYHSFRSFVATETLSSGSSFLSVPNSESNIGTKIMQDMLNQVPSSLGEILDSSVVDRHDGCAKLVSSIADSAEGSVDGLAVNPMQRFSVHDNHIDYDPASVIESIRREEFGLDQNLSVTENKMLEKQHTRLGRALHCLSQELYSQDSHFLLELVQNADDNIYPENVEPTLTFILQETGIIVLNNEKGFSANNIRALCDVGNSTKKAQNAGYIGKKGIGFKSVFRVSDAPEIHSNGFHLKYDITEGQIGFVLPTIVPPCNIDLYTRLASGDTDEMNRNSWNTCIVLPFRLNLSDGISANNILSMFSDLHPSLLLFLHRLQCIKFRNILDDSLIVMRKEVIGDGIIKVAIGNEKMTWLVVSQKLQAHVIRPDVQTTEISIAFTLQETVDGELVPILNQQPVFAFLPLRTYGLKFILQGDFILPSSREEVDGNSPWNQWLLSEFPGLFVGAERSFCDLPCFRESPGKAVAAFMSYIPLLGEVHGFFASLPRMILSKLRLSNCLLLEGDEKEWVPPCRVLRNWTDQARSILPDSLIHEHLGLGYLNKDIVLSDTSAAALGVEDYGPEILLKVLISLCCSNNGLKSMGYSWLSSCLSAIYMLSSHSSGQTPSSRGTGSDITYELRKTPFIPLSNGKYGSVEEGTIWFHSDVASLGINDESVFKVFPKLYDRLRIVSPNLISAAASVENSSSDTSIVENVTRLLYRVGVQQLSDHEIVKVHILPALFGGGSGLGQEELMTEYLSFVMFHLQSCCTTCSSERGDIVSELRDKALISTNYGYKRLSEVPIHFSRTFGNPVDVNKLIIGLDVKWHEIDAVYLKHPITKLVSGGMLKWRNFLLEIGVTDFVKIVQVEKCISGMSHDVMKTTMWNVDTFSTGSVAKNWESEELFHLLSKLSSRGHQEKCKYFLEVLDTLWDDYFSDKVSGYCIDSTGESKPFKSSLICVLQDASWIVSSIDNELHYPKDLFHDCTAVNSILGVSAPYAIPKVRSRKLVDDIGLKTQVTLDDALSILKLWRRPEITFKASVSQMSDFYTFIWKEMSTSKQKIVEELHSGPFIFVPRASDSSHEDAIPGAFLSPQEVYWYDSTGSMDQMELNDQDRVSDIASSLRKMLRNFYPNLHDFFVNECGVDEIPPFRSYLQILLQLSTIALPHQAAKTVFQVFLQWGDAIKSGSMSLEDVEYLQDSLLKEEYAVLPTRQDKWVSLHSSFGLVCWCDDDDLGREFKHLEGVNFLYFGEFPDEEHATLQAKILIIMNRLGIPALSKIVTREAIYYGPADCSFIFSLVNWALPYAERYILNAHPDKFFQLKQSNFEDLRRLQIVAVEKLFYRNVMKCEITSKKRYECSCLLQDNILYCSQESDSHSIFMELSRLLYDGTPELHFANFLHMIATMTESGSTEEQIEFFILNSQKVPKLPPDETEWSLSVENNATLVENSVSNKTEEQNPTVFKRRPGINSNWPPADWKTAPGFNSACCTFGFNTPAGSSLQQTTKRDGVKENLEKSVVEVGSESIIDGDPIVIIPAASPDAEISESQFNLSSNTIDSDMNVALDSVDLVDNLNFGSSNSMERDHLYVHATNAQQALFTGRLGESVAFKYFTEKVDGMFVKWVNKANETGLPYDITVGDDENREYIEVKATKSARKNWFVISMREWQFAVEKGESFSIAHVTLSGNEMAKITIYKNPARLCKLGNLKLAMLIPK